MFALPCHKNNPIKITLKNGEMILAKITRFNESTGKVSWVDKNGNWKGSLHCSKVVNATPDEVLAFHKATEATLAPVHPIMAKWSLGKMKQGPLMREGHYYSAYVMLNGTKCGEVIDDGSGGCVITRFNAQGLALAFSTDCIEWCKVNGANTDHLEAESEFWGWWEEGRTKGKDAVTFFKEKEEEMATWSASIKPITNSDEFAKAVNG